jgi:RNA polymerase sigma-70 factor (ECF subfamily)
LQNVTNVVKVNKSSSYDRRQSKSWVTPSLNFAALFDTHYSRLYAYVRSQVADRETAEDLTAATFERAFSRSQSYDPAKASFATWLFRIAHNLVINHYATTSRNPPPYELDEVTGISTADLSPEQQFLRQEQQRILGETIATLSERDQEIIQLKFYGRLTNREIAEVLELNEKTVSVIILRALQKLKAQLESQEAP